MPNSGFSWGAKLSEIADAVWTRTTRTLSNLDDTRAARIDNLDAAISTRATAADVWEYANRTLTQAKFPFWSAIITQTQGSISVAASTETYVNIQPPAEETWIVTITVDYPWRNTAGTDWSIRYYDYDGTTRRPHAHSAVGSNYPDNNPIVIQRILTNSLYASIGIWNNLANSYTAYYGYSGFKLSQPRWTTQKVNAVETPFKRPVKDIVFKQLADKAYLNPENKVAYHLATEILAVDPVKNVPVETVEYHVLEEDLVKGLVDFKAYPKETGWERIFNKLAQEGIVL